MHGPTYIFWADLTPFSLQAELGEYTRPAPVGDERLGPTQVITS